MSNAMSNAKYDEAKHPRTGDGKFTEKRFSEAEGVDLDAGGFGVEDVSTSTKTVLKDGTIEYLDAKGQRHRTDGPAIERANGNHQWWVDGQLHRKNGPAIEYVNGHREWWVDGQLHRENGPAIEYANGHREWWVDDELHRTDGPAVEYADGGREFWLDGVELSEDEFNARTA